MTDEEYQERLEIVSGDEPDFSFPIHDGVMECAENYDI